MHYVYFIRSESRPNKTYAGMTEDVMTRLAAHNSGDVPFTSRYRPWSLISYVAVQTPAKAAELEQYFKIGSGHAFWHKRFQ
jgi:predicted GIY-YIG superfamily endonuclease